jgi:hypothetical protein
MTMLLTDGQEAISYASAVESNCAVEQSQSGCQAAVSGSETYLASMQNLLDADATVGVPAGERSRESALASAMGSALSQLNRCGQLAVFALGGTSISLAIDIEFYWGALAGCASPSAPLFSPQVAALQAWYRDAQTYAGP